MVMLQYGPFLVVPTTSPIVPSGPPRPLQQQTSCVVGADRTHIAYTRQVDGSICGVILLRSTNLSRSHFRNSYFDNVGERSCGNAGGMARAIQEKDQANVLDVIR